MKTIENTRGVSNLTWKDRAFAGLKGERRNYLGSIYESLGAGAYMSVSGPLYLPDVWKLVEDVTSIPKEWASSRYAGAKGELRVWEDDVYRSTARGAYMYSEGPGEAAYLQWVEEEKDDSLAIGESDLTYSGDRWTLSEINSMIATYSNTQQSTTKQQEEIKMTNNLTVKTIRLLDCTQGIKKEAAIVGTFEDVVVQNELLELAKQEILMNYDVATMIEEHNKARSKMVDLDIKKRTGNEVYLDPVELKDLEWSVSS